MGRTVAVANRRMSFFLLGRQKSRTKYGKFLVSWARNSVFTELLHCYLRETVIHGPLRLESMLSADVSFLIALEGVSRVTSQSCLRWRDFLKNGTQQRCPATRVGEGDESNNIPKFLLQSCTHTRIVFYPLVASNEFIGKENVA